jgi:hypothetical protein
VDISVLAVSATETGDGVLLVLALVVAGGWLASLWLHPFTACSACGGTPRSYGAVATGSFRICATCGGTGRRLRTGARLFARHRS